MLVQMEIRLWQIIKLPHMCWLESTGLSFGELTTGSGIDEHWVNLSPCCHISNVMCYCGIASLLSCPKSPATELYVQQLAQAYNEETSKGHKWMYNSLFRLTTKKISEVQIPVYCEGNLPVTNGFPSQMALFPVMTSCVCQFWLFQTSTGLIK